MGQLAAVLYAGSLMFDCVGHAHVFRYLGEIYFVLFQPKIGRAEEALGGLFISLRWAKSSQVLQWMSPMTSRAVSDWRFFLASSDDSHELSFLFVYCLVFTHYSSVLFFISCKNMKNIITTFPFSLGFLTFSWCEASRTEKSEILWALCRSDGISGGSSTFSVWIVSKSALPSDFPITISFVKSCTREFYFSLNCLCALTLQKLNRNIC